MNNSPIATPTTAPAPQAAADSAVVLTWAPALVFLVGLGIAAGAALWKKNDIGHDAGALFQYSVQTVTDHVNSRLQRPLEGLLEARGMYAADPRVDRATFRAYLKALDDHYVVKFMESGSENANALGLDAGSQALRQAAVQRAVDTAEPSASATIALVHDQRTTPGMLVFLPLYANGTHPTTVAERRAALVGLVYTPVVMSKLLDGMSDVRA